MLANYLDENNKLKSCIVTTPSQQITDLFQSKSFPVIKDNKLYSATYEREIDSVFLHYEISHEEIIKRANQELYNRYNDALTIAFESNKNYISDIFKELSALNPPWNE